MESKILEIIAESLDVDQATLTNETHIQNDLEADSVDIITLINDLEDAFEIDVPTDDIQNLQTVGAIVAYVSKATA